MKPKQNESEYEQYIIPRDVLTLKKLTPNAKLLYAVILTICDKHGYCTAKNKHFGSLLGISDTSTSLLVKKLEDKKLIKLKYLNRKFMRIIFTFDADSDSINIVLSKVKDALSKVKDIYNIYRQEYYSDILADDYVEDIDIKTKIWTGKDGVKRGKD